MTTTHDLTPAYLQHIYATPHILRVGVLAPVNGEGNVDLDKRWTKPLAQRGFEVIRIPVKPLDDPESNAAFEALEHLDGLLMPGGDSNIHPSIYKQFVTQSDELHDVDRDLFAIELLRDAYGRDLPVLGICRGFQEMVVAFGGELTRLDQDGEFNHAAGYDAPVVEGRRCQKTMDLPVHPIEIQSGGHLARIFEKKVFLVNSIHVDGTKALKGKLADEFHVEAMAPDGVIEGISAKNKSFFMGLQPHYELPGPQHRGVYDEFERYIRQNYRSRASVAEPSKEAEIEHHA